jgi:hypothetical protein
MMVTYPTTIAFFFQHGEGHFWGFFLIGVVCPFIIIVDRLVVLLFTGIIKTMISQRIGCFGNCFFGY